MNITRILAVAERVLREIRNERRSILLIVAAPIFAMFVFGVAFGGNVSDVAVIVVDQTDGSNSPSSISSAIIQNLDRDTLDVTFSDDLEIAIEKVEQGEAFAVIVFPNGFDEAIAGRTIAGNGSEPAVIKIIADRSNLNVANAIVASVNEAVGMTMKDRGIVSVFSIDISRTIYGGNARFMDFFVPGVMSFIVFLITTMLTMISFISERTMGTLQRMMATPAREEEIIFGYAIAFSGVGIIQSGLLLIVAVLVFDITIVGNVLILFLIIVLLSVVSQSLGILLSNMARRMDQALNFMPFVFLSAMLLSGVFWPVEAIPQWLRPASFLLPLTYAVEASRSVTLRGWGLAEIGIDLLALVGFALGFLALAIMTLKRSRK